MINALTIDVEDYFHVKAFEKVVAPSDWQRFPSRVEMNTRRVLEILGRYGVRATFFILGWVAQHYPFLVKEILAAGHQIGCHGYAHRSIDGGSDDEFRQDVRRAKNIIENTAGIRVTSYRAPSYSITRRTLWALDILGDEGFEYDSSIFPVVHDNYGIPDAPRFPHFKSLQGGKTIKEFPPSTVRLFGVNFPVAGGGYLRLFPYGVTAWAIDQINNRERQPALAYLHPWELDPDQPRINASWRSRFRHYQNLRSAGDKLSRLLQQFSWAPMEKVASIALH